MAAVPVYPPADPGIGAEETPAISTTRTHEEIKVLQRERNLDVPSWLYLAASLIVLGVLADPDRVAELGCGDGSIARRSATE